MKTFTLKFSAFFVAFVLIAAAFSSTSCKKDKTCHGTVTVLDTGGALLDNATVKLAAPSVNGQVEYEAITDGSGTATFEVKLPAIFDVTATKGTRPGYVAVGVLRLDEPGKTGEVSIQLE